MVKARKRLIKFAALAGFGLGTAPFMIGEFPELQGPKNRFLPFLNFKQEYSLPTCVEPVSNEPLEKPELQDARQTLEDRISKLLITTNGNMDPDFYPGGILLTKGETRKGHLFGTYHCYDSQETRSTVEKTLAKAQHYKKRILIFDEGEGGFVGRIGALPPAGHIGRYYITGRIDENNQTLKGILEPTKSKKQRAKQIKSLFDEYARELKNQGVDAVFGPELDVVSKTPNNNPIQREQRSFGHLHSATIELANMYIKAMHKYGINVVGKHFLGAGIPKEGDLHYGTVEQTRRIQPRLRAANVYSKLRNNLDGVMVTHLENKSDNSRPYPISHRALQLLTQPRYADGRYRGIDFGGLVIVDDIQMKGLLDYIKNENNLTERDKELTKGCTTLAARAAVLSIDAGANAIILKSPNVESVLNSGGLHVESIVKGISYAAMTDSIFRLRLEESLKKYEVFAQRN